MSDGLASVLPRWVALASQYLRWPPDVIWQATPSEFFMALGDPEDAASRPLTRGEFEHLMESERNGRSD